MLTKCVSGKKIFATETLAEDALLELWTENDYVKTHAPQAVYKCHDCGFFHLTSRPPMNDNLAQYLSSDKYKLNKEASRWRNKFRNK